MMANLLADYAGPVRAIAGYTKYQKTDPEFRSPCAVDYLPISKLGAKWYEPLVWRAPEFVAQVARLEIRRALARARAKIVMAVFPFDDWFVGTYLAARDLGLPYTVYMHDLWRENMQKRPAGKALAEKYEERILRGAKRVFCTTSAMQRHYEARYGIRGDLLPHVIPDQELRRAPAEIRAVGGGKRTVLFVGALSPYFNQDSLAVLARAGELLPSNYELLFCSPNGGEEFARAGISSPRIRFAFVPRREVQRLQTEAAVLIAPLSHKNGTDDEVKTVFSTKLLEYMVAGRPILVFAPSGSFHADSASQSGWGHVVTKDDPQALADAILRLSTDQSLAGSVVRGALEEAARRSAKIHAEKLRQWVLKDMPDV